MEERETLLREKHIAFFRRCLGVIPSMFQEFDPNRMTILFFCISGLDLLKALNVLDESKQDIIDWIYAQQILPDKSNPDCNMSMCGFRGGSYMGVPFDNEKSPKGYPYDRSHIAMTYSALNCLLILGDDLSRVNKGAVVQGLKALQNEDGSFSFSVGGEESDMRFVYCACSVSYILNDWSGVNVEKVKEYIRGSQGYDFGFGQGPLLESHGGSTFCAVASLVLMNQLENTFSEKEIEGLRRFCLQRQKSGFQGRPNKAVDTCYSFWLGASLNLLGFCQFINWEWNRGSVMSTQDSMIGGFSKCAGAHPDPLHSYLGLCALAIGNEEGLEPVNTALNLSERAVAWLRTIHSRK